MAALSSAPPCPFRRLAGVTAKIQNLGPPSPPACRPTDETTNLTAVLAEPVPQRRSSPSNSLNAPFLSIAAGFPKIPSESPVAGPACRLVFAKPPELSKQFGRGMVFKRPLCAAFPFPQKPLAFDRRHVNSHPARSASCELPRRHQGRSAPISRDSYPQEKPETSSKPSFKTSPRFPFPFARTCNPHHPEAHANLFTPRKLAASLLPTNFPFPASPFSPIFRRQSLSRPFFLFADTRLQILAPTPLASVHDATYSVPSPSLCQAINSNRETATIGFSVDLLPKPSTVVKPMRESV